MEISQLQRLEKLPPKVLESLKADIESKIPSASDGKLQPDRGLSEEGELVKGNLKEAVLCEWSEFMRMAAENMQYIAPRQETENLSAQSRSMDWSTLLDWVPSPEKSLEENLQELVFRYQVMWNYINVNYAGPQRAALLNALDQLMMAKLEALFFTNLQDLSLFFTENGESQAGKNILPDLRQGAYNMIRASAHAVQAAPEKTPGAVSKEAIPLRLSASKELSINIPALRRPDGSTGYSMRDLSVAGRFVRELNPPSYQSPPSEAPVYKALAGLDLGLLELKSTVFFQYAQLTPAMERPLRHAMEQFLTSIRTGTTSGSPQEPQSGASLGREAVAPRHTPYRLTGPSSPNIPLPSFQSAEAQQIASRMSQTYAQTRNVRDSILSAARYAKELLAPNNQEPGDAGSSRSQEVQAFWKGFLLELAQPGVSVRKAPLQLIRENWNHFVKTLELYQNRHTDLYFGAYHSGILEIMLAKKEATPRPDGRGIAMAAILLFALFPPAFAFLTGKPVAGLILLALDVCAVVVLQWTRRR